MSSMCHSKYHQNCHFSYSLKLENHLNNFFNFILKISLIFFSFGINDFDNYKSGIDFKLL